MNPGHAQTIFYFLPGYMPLSAAISMIFGHFRAFITPDTLILTPSFLCRYSMNAFTPDPDELADIFFPPPTRF